MAKAAAPYTNEYGDRINLVIYIMHDVLTDMYLYIYLQPKRNATCLFGIFRFQSRRDD